MGGTMVSTILTMKKRVYLQGWGRVDGEEFGVGACAHHQCGMQQLGRGRQVIRILGLTRHLRWKKGEVIYSETGYLTEKGGGQKER